MTPERIAELREWLAGVADKYFERSDTHQKALDILSILDDYEKMQDWTTRVQVVRPTVTMEQINDLIDTILAADMADCAVDYIVREWLLDKGVEVIEKKEK